MAAHDTLLINLRQDIGEQNNLAQQMPDTLEMMVQKMNDFKKELGPLPERLKVR